MLKFSILKLPIYVIGIHEALKVAQLFPCGYLRALVSHRGTYAPPVDYWVAYLPRGPLPRTLLEVFWECLGNYCHCFD